jgi:kinesin family member 3B
MQQQLELQEESTMEIRDTFTSLQQEVELKTRKLKKCYAKCMALKQEIQETKDEHNREQRELEMTQNEMIKELKRLLVIIDNFVPAEVKSRLFCQARYDEELEEWTLSANSSNDYQTVRRPVAVVNRRRPMSEYALNSIKQKGTDTIRFRGENVIENELDMPMRTTHDYKNPRVSASLQAVLAEAMQTDNDIVDITEQQQSYANQMRQRLDKITRRNLPQENQPQTQPLGVVTNGRAKSSKLVETNIRGLSAKTKLNPPGSAYPKARGLIQK